MSQGNLGNSTTNSPLEEYGRLGGKVHWSHWHITSYHIIYPVLSSSKSTPEVLRAWELIGSGWDRDGISPDNSSEIFRKSQPAKVHLFWDIIVILQNDGILQLPNYDQIITLGRLLVLQTVKKSIRIRELSFILTLDTVKIVAEKWRTEKGEQRTWYLSSWKLTAQSLQDVTSSSTAWQWGQIIISETKVAFKIHKVFMSKLKRIQENYLSHLQSQILVNVTQDYPLPCLACDAWISMCPSLHRR